MVAEYAVTSKVRSTWDAPGPPWSPSTWHTRADRQAHLIIGGQSCSVPYRSYQRTSVPIKWRVATSGYLAPKRRIERKKNPTRANPKKSLTQHSRVTRRYLFFFPHHNKGNTCATQRIIQTLSTLHSQFPSLRLTLLPSRLGLEPSQVRLESHSREDTYP